MCYQVTYTLPCEHVRTQIIYCADATVETSSGSSGKSPSSHHHHHKASSSKHHHGGGKSSSTSKSHSHGHSHHHKGSSSPGSSGGGNPRKVPCVNLQMQSLPYPTPPSYADDPASFFSSPSPLSPRCPLGRDCPFEQKNRCWNCCWCGKTRNTAGRCSCVHLIDGSLVRCEHICCGQCEPADASQTQPVDATVAQQQQQQQYGEAQQQGYGYV